MATIIVFSDLKEIVVQCTSIIVLTTYFTMHRLFLYCRYPLLMLAILYPLLFYT